MRLYFKFNGNHFPRPRLGGTRETLALFAFSQNAARESLVPLPAPLALPVCRAKEKESRERNARATSACMQITGRRWAISELGFSKLAYLGRGYIIVLQHVLDYLRPELRWKSVVEKNSQGSIVWGTVKMATHNKGHF